MSKVSLPAYRRQNNNILIKSKNKKINTDPGQTV